jgi:uncharacterized protein with FMN-binding domain
MIGWLIAFSVLVILGIGGGIGWSFVSKEHREARGLPLESVDFSTLRDGTYHGTYEGGMHKWRANECQVTVASGRVTGINLITSQDPGGKNTQHQELFDRVLKAQSLQVDTVSGATLTSKAYLKAIENALVPAGRE